MKGKAFAKVNLILEITGKREDGYHEIDTVMALVNVYDEISIDISGKGIKVTCDVPDIPSDETNLAYKAAAYMIEKYRISKGVDIKIKKNIPSGAGMGGGSSDAAWVINAVNIMFGLGLDKKELEECAGHMGADVPFFIRGGVQRAQGIGEKLTEISGTAPLDLLIVKPEFSVPTALAYKELKKEERGSHDRCEKFITALKENDMKSICSLADNTLECSSIRMYPEIRSIKEDLLSCGAGCALMTGSGSAVFGIFNDAASARSAGEAFRTLYPDMNIFVSHM